ncbi:MAG: Unknown protein [uncultured Thiotrichaceae bacterium]|uniref:Uncharacterized protein n=1 Tax=uncultured Thiotrichaceae bacterium TaxID=298394 RepID=A0A6S6TC06_9GAMM|nr:MAG: Unknown protein [uncultured Thiotrichaceae bacterium]
MNTFSRLRYSYYREPIKFDATDMFQTYSKRQLPPFYAQVQIIKTPKARVVSIDGKHWEIQYEHISRNQGMLLQFGSKPIKSYIRVAEIIEHELNVFALPPTADRDDIDKHILEIQDFIKTVTLPFPAKDLFEYWLLDAKNERPLALIFSCCEAHKIPSFPEKTAWTALPASIMTIESTEQEKATETPPVNYRLETLVNKRAGFKPKAKWFNRYTDTSESFPNLLVSNDWEDEYENDLYTRYIEHQSPRLLTLHCLDHSERSHLEECAKTHALEVERFYRLYPEVINQPVINGIRVEARMRQAVLNQSLQSNHKRYRQQ